MEVGDTAVSTEPVTLNEAQKRDAELSIVRSWLEGPDGPPDLEEIQPENSTIKTYWFQREKLHIRDDTLCRETLDGEMRVVLPKELRKQYLSLAHTGITGGHLGIRRTRGQIRRRAYWVGWSKDVWFFCRSCTECCQYHRGQPPRQGLLQVVPCGEPFEKVSVDVTGPHPRSRRGNVYILTVMDNFTKFVEAIPMANQEACTVAKKLVEVVICRYGAPMQILTDKGTNFESAVFQGVCRLLGIDKARTTSYRPQTNGMIERFHRTMNAMLGKVVNSNQRDWDDCLSYVLAAYRSSTHDATGFSPNYLMFGHENRAPIDLVFGRPTEEVAMRPTYAAYVEELGERIETAYKDVRCHLRRAAERRKRTYDLRVREVQFKEGDWVWMYTPRRYKGKSPKWGKNYTGPFQVVRQYGKVNYVLRKSTRSVPFLSHVDKMKLCLSQGHDPSGKTAMEEGRNTSTDDSALGTGDNPAVPQREEDTRHRPRRVAKRPTRYAN